MRRILRGLGILAAGGLLLVILLIAQIYYYGAIHELEVPVEEEALDPLPQRVEIGDQAYRLGANWIRRNEYGIHELYIEGGDWERGRVNGALTRELMEAQEQAFTDQIREMIPFPRYLSLLKYLIGFMNRDLEDYISPSLKREIYGVSRYASPKFDWIGEAYARQLNYHAAHDIGHALQSLMLVGCTSFGLWDGQTQDGSLLVGRNFDFWVGDAFAEQKILAFVKPDSGYGYVSVTWGGFVGVVSGMNDQGLTITLNAAPGGLSWKARTPVSLVAREILQYASNLEEALDIARRRPLFVSESLLIASARDGKAVVVEKTPEEIAVVSGREGRLPCTNYYQSELFAGRKNNLQEIQDGASAYRYRRLEELLDREGPLSPRSAAEILRDRRGLGDQSIGWGNEKAINQFIAHHSIIFQPDSLRFWMSTSPWQMGDYICYDLKAVLHGDMPAVRQPLYDTQRTIKEDPFVQSEAFARYLLYRKMLQEYRQGGELDTAQWLSLNPDYYETYEIAGDFARAKGWVEAACSFYLRALQKEIPRSAQRRSIEEKMPKP